MVMTMLRFLLLLPLVALSSCDIIPLHGLLIPVGDVVSSRFEQSMMMHSGEAVATLNADSSYTIYVGADPHISDNTDNLERFVSIVDNHEKTPCGIILGDCIDKRGLIPRYAEILALSSTQREERPIFNILGNHDTYFSGWNDFKSYIGASVYWFSISTPSDSDLYIALDSASGTLGVDQHRWLESLLRDRRKHYRHCIILTHTNLFYTDNSQQGSGNMPMEETMKLVQLFAEHNVSLVLQGHDHYREELAFMGVNYTIVGSMRCEMEQAEYLQLIVSDDDIESIWCYL